MNKQNVGITMVRDINRDRVLYLLTMGLFFLFFAFPIVDYVLRIVLGVPVLSSLWDELVLVGLLGILGWKLFFRDVNFRELEHLPLAKPMFLLVLYAIALIFIDYHYMSIGVEGFRASFQYLFAFFAAYFLVRSQRDMINLLSIVVGVGILLGLHGVYQYIIGVPTPSHWVDAGESVRTRAFSIVGSPNVLGGFMALTMPITLGMGLWVMQFGQGWLNRYRLIGLGLIGASGIISLCLLVTFSRGALLALVASLAVVAILFALMYNRRFIFVVIGLGVVGVGLAYFFAPTVIERLLYVFSPEYFEKSATNGRIARWLNAFDKMRHEPFFGAGLGQYGGAVGARHFSTIYVDNYYAKTMAEMGLVGIGLFLWLIGSLIRSGYQAWVSVWKSSYRFLAAGLFGGLLAVILHNGVENIFEVPFMNVLFWLCAGLLLGLPKWQPTDQAAELIKEDIAMDNTDGQRRRHDNER